MFVAKKKEECRAKKRGKFGNRRRLGTKRKVVRCYALWNWLYITLDGRGVWRGIFHCFVFMYMYEVPKAASSNDVIIRP